MLQWPMTISHASLATSPAKRTPREEEQFLCNEALRTGAFDSISDSEWILMCERAASKGRHETGADTVTTART